MVKRKGRKPGQPLEGKIVGPESENLPEKLPHGEGRVLRGVDFELSWVDYPAKIKGRRLMRAIEDIQSKIYAEKPKKKLPKK